MATVFNTYRLKDTRNQFGGHGVGVSVRSPFRQSKRLVQNASSYSAPMTDVQRNKVHVPIT